MEGILITIGEYSFLIHQSILIWFGVLIFVGILLTWGGKKIRMADPIKEPEGAVLVFENLGNIIKGVIGGNLNERTWRYLPFYGTIMICMAISCLMGLIGLQPPTSNLTLNLTLALIMVILIHGTDIRLHGIKGKLKSLAEPIPLLFPLNVIGDLALPVSLTLRLFGNLLGGTIIIALLYNMIKAIMPYGILAFAVTPFLHLYFDVFTAFMQTYIFFMLTSFFLSEVLDD